MEARKCQCRLLEVYELMFKSPVKMGWKPINSHLSLSVSVPWFFVTILNMYDNENII